MTYRDVVRKLRKAGFEFDRSAAGSHEIWHNAETRLRTTVPNHPGDIPAGTLRAIIRQTGPDEARVRRLVSSTPPILAAQLSALCRAQPFNPFRLHMADGRSLDVEHPDFLARSPAGRTAIVYG